MSDFLRDDQGATAVEYGIIAAMIFVVILVSVNAVANNSVSMWNSIATHVSGTTSP